MTCGPLIPITMKLWILYSVFITVGMSPVLNDDTFSKLRFYIPLPWDHLGVPEGLNPSVSTSNLFGVVTLECSSKGLSSLNTCVSRSQNVSLEEFIRRLITKHVRTVF